MAQTVNYWQQRENYYFWSNANNLSNYNFEIIFIIFTFFPVSYIEFQKWVTYHRKCWFSAVHRPTDLLQMFQFSVELPVLLKFRTTFVNFTLIMLICTHLPLGNNRIQLCHANYVPVLAQIMAQRVKAAPITVTQGRSPFSAERAPAGAVTDAPRERKIGFCLHFTT